ncbi:MAG: DUF4442 domain-containing protein [Chitinophagaceae bacterium]|nr:DUF4442 domain-containing protein [Chitinophagaceae bacterium]
MNSNFNLFKNQITSPIKFKLFTLTKLPMAFFSGLKVEALEPNTAAVSVRFKWINQNPFKSIYFAVLSMAAELSTGVLAFAQIYKRQPTVSMLVVKLEAEFYKKAVGKIVFTCKNGDEVIAAIEDTIATKQGVTVACTSVGIDEKGDEVAKFIFTWSFKSK